MTFTKEQRDRLELMATQRAFSGPERAAIRAALARIDELEIEVDEFREMWPLDLRCL